jgi:rubredoxin/hemerythrin-like domain-containing protein
LVFASLFTLAIRLLPIGLLMKEHRLIEELVSDLQLELTREKAKKTVNFPFLDLSIDFFRTYADHCHHGKEQNILFRELVKKPLSVEHSRIMNELIADHVYARKTVTELVDAKADFAQGVAVSIEKISGILERLVELYPKHIAKEDKLFFYQAMFYFSAEEQKKIMQEFWESDRQLIHEKYQVIVENASSMLQRPDLSKWKCKVCDYVYDSLKGDPEHGIKPGTAFTELLDSWVCPVCFAPKSAFKELK